MNNFGAGREGGREGGEGFFFVPHFFFLAHPLLPPSLRPSLPPGWGTAGSVKDPKGYYERCVALIKSISSR
jgi:hypothetical protein